jgi:aryl-alcohol dehydrogenase-like predicted oxidoreductase
MHNLVQQGKILYWGTSEWSGVEIMEAHRVAHQYRLIAPVVEQPQYHMLERYKMENEFLGIFNTVGMGTTIWSPLASGLLSGKYNEGIPEGSRFALKGFDWLKERWMVDEKISKVRQLARLAEKLHISLPELAIAWCIRNPHVTTAILGATRKEQLVQNLKAIEAVGKLDASVMDEIDLITGTKPLLPEY